MMVLPIPSFGIAGLDNDTTLGLFEKADIALYHAKEKGRNQTVVYQKENPDFNTGHTHSKKSTPTG